jgi:hypothetical protein
VLEERGLACADLADEGDDRAVARPRTVEEAVEQALLALATHQHGASVRGGLTSMGPGAGD